jgi:pyruvate dehydrogenase E1 component alpha subunit
MLLETVSYRLRGHSVVDPARYRSTEDAEKARREDSLPAFRAELVTTGVLDDKTAAEIAADADKAARMRRPAAPAAGEGRHDGDQLPAGPARHGAR